MNFHENLQRLRKQAGLSQEAVAQKLFLSRQSISKWENGGAEPGIENLKALAKLYGVTVDELVGNGQPENTSEENARKKDGTWIYGALLTIRVVALIGLLLTCMTYGYEIKDVWYAFPDLFFLIIGAWITHPYMWLLLICTQLFEAVFGMIDLITMGSFPAVLSIFFNGLCAGILYAPNLRVRFGVKGNRV